MTHMLYEKVMACDRGLILRLLEDPVCTFSGRN